MVSDNNITAKKMVPDNNSFEELRHVVDEPGIVNISTSSNGTMTIETEKGNSNVLMKTEPGIVNISVSSNGTMTIETEKGNSDVLMKTEPGIVNISVSSNGTMTIETEKGNSDVFMKSTMSGTCSEKEFVTYPKSTSNATSRKL